MSNRQISNALISVFNKDGLDTILDRLVDNHIHIFSTGGTQTYIERKGVAVSAVEDLTNYPSFLGGRVKTLHPKIFGGILARRDNPLDQQEVMQYEIPFFDLVIVDIYPFEETYASGANHQDIIEKIDIGGISLIRAAAKNYADVLVVSSREQYAWLADLLATRSHTTGQERRHMAGLAFDITTRYDGLIANYLTGGSALTLRYGENPHQKAKFIGALDNIFDKLQGKDLSYNNLLDIDATLAYLRGHESPCMAIVKHNNACGLAEDELLPNAWRKALAADPVSAFGGIIGSNRPIDLETALLINDLFFEVIIAPDFHDQAFQLLSSRKNRVILRLKRNDPPATESRTLLHGTLIQDKDLAGTKDYSLRVATHRQPSPDEMRDMLFANEIAKNSKSNTIVLVRDRQLLGMGCGMTSRIDALKHAIAKAQEARLDLENAAMASDAFFPFPDCVQIAKEKGINSVIHPGGSVRDQDSIDYCNANNMAMVITGFRHFKH
ncbi:MAG: bifunctional phosphoribosylaminoimidazolecarboxamide formyltransferase/IMP cyclohydrolase [Bacteroidetes bacterium]|nr:bifunctional phosphoribosylaminoimidazolecarboxamide formyltransferase/IMP cyclohydrolase [Bacteroidota bacterium]